MISLVYHEKCGILTASVFTEVAVFVASFKDRLEDEEYASGSSNNQGSITSVPEMPCRGACAGIFCSDSKTEAQLSIRPECCMDDQISIPPVSSCWKDVIGGENESSMASWLDKK
jgi:hypothetical protein